ncbi:zinc finger CCCH domain-containing protein 10-like [Lineus longissimus]|uniref:zinc finger CCCH domain-containing protein 10-like n=1 Tax=Lineus longissimus TaxID=88925 RepID=UPI00315C7B30
MSDKNSDDEKMNGKIGDDICRDFLRNVCKRGKRCKYRHPDNFEARVLGKQQEYTFCHDFQNTGCRRQNCKFIHCTREEEEYYKQTGQLPVRLQQAAALGLGVQPSELPVLKGEVPICKDYLKGECRRAGKCKYRHVSASDYEIELRRLERQSRSLITSRFDTFDDILDRYELESPLKRRRLEDYEFNNVLDRYGTHATTPTATMTRPISVATDYRLIEDENTILRRKVEELKKQCNDLAATNEVLLEQNARYRMPKTNTVSLQSVTTPSIVNVSQIATPVVTPSSISATSITPALASLTSLTQSINTSLPQPIALNGELASQHQQALHQQMEQIAQAAELASQANLPTAQTLANVPDTINAAIVTPVSITQGLSNLPNVSLAQVTVTQNMAPAVSMSQTMSQTLPQINISGPNTPMVSYPIVSQGLSAMSAVRSVSATCIQ